MTELGSPEEDAEVYWDHCWKSRFWSLGKSISYFNQQAGSYYTVTSHVIIGTLVLLISMKKLSLIYMKNLVFDEVDHMLAR